MKKKWMILPLALLLVMANILAGCNPSTSSDQPSSTTPPTTGTTTTPSTTPSSTTTTGTLTGALDINGSNTVTPVTTLFAEELMKTNPRLNISVSGPGSGAGIAAIINKTTDICQSSRPIRQSEIDQGKANGVDIKEVRVATDAIAVIVHPSNPVTSLTIQQLSDIYTGKITNWSQIGGNNAPVVALARDTNSGTHVYFKEAVVQMDGLPTKDTSLEYHGSVQFLPSTSTGVTQVGQNTNAIFYIGLGYMDNTVKALGIKKTAADSAVLPSLETALNDTYPVSRGLFYYIDGAPSGLIKAFIDFALSDKGQELVQKSGFVPVKKSTTTTTTTPAPAPAALTGTLDINGSNTVTPITTVFAEDFMKTNPKVNISVSGPGSGAGIAAIINKTTDICQSSRPIKQSEIDQGKANGVDIKEVRIATDAIAVIVHPSNPVTSLTIEQLSDIYTGKITNWSQVGGSNAPVVALSRDTNSGTHVYFKEAVVQMDGLPTKDTSLEYHGSVQFLPSTSTGVTQVGQNANAIFYIGLGYMDNTVKAIGIKKTAADSAVMPSLETALNDSYPIARGLFYYIDGAPSGLIKAFIDFALSDKGQELVQKSGFVPVKK